MLGFGTNELIILSPILVFAVIAIIVRVIMKNKQPPDAGGPR